MISLLRIRAPSALLAATVTLALAGCGSTPRQDAALNEARVAVTVAHSDPRVTGDALAELATADRALGSADVLMASGKPLAEVDHEAYLATRYAQAAQQHGQLIASTAAIAELGNRRNAVLLQARERDARRATALATTMTIEADRARLDAAVSANDADRARRDSAASLNEADRARLDSAASANDANSARRDSATSLNEADRARFDSAASANDADSARRDAAESAKKTLVANERADRLAAELTDLQGRHTDRGVVVTLGGVLFATNDTQLREGSQGSIGRLTTFLSNHPNRTIRVEGFTDNVGNDGYNRDLSDRRAGSVADALTRGGIDRDRIRTQGYGMAFPVAPNATPLGRQQNRRVEVVISDGDQRVPERTE